MKMKHGIVSIISIILFIASSIAFGEVVDPNDAETYDMQGIAFGKKGDFDSAIKNFNKAIKINPRYAGAYYNRGYAYKIQGLYELAIEDYTKALEINPRLARAYVNRGRAYNELNKPVKVCADYERACSLGKCRAYNWAKKNKECE